MANTDVITTPDEGAFLPVDPESMSILRENLGDGAAIDPTMLTQAKVPSGTGAGDAFMMETIDGPIATRTITGVVILWQTQRMLWEPGDPNGRPPLCASSDGEIGRGDNGTRPADEDEAIAQGWDLRYDAEGEEVWSGRFSCAECPLSKMGSAEGGRGMACTEKRLLYVREPGALLPTVINVPPTSIRNWQAYSLRLVANAVPYYGAVTTIGLEGATNARGTDYSKLTFKRERPMSPEEREAMTAYRAALVPVLESALLVEGDLPMTMAGRDDEEQIDKEPIPDDA